MEFLLVQLAALIRPLAGIKYASSVFELLGITLFAALVAALLIKSAVHKSLTLGAIDLVIVAFAVWCLATYVVYIESAVLRQVAKLIIPMLSYVVVKNVVRNETEYRRLLFWIIVGFVVPTLASAALISAGRGYQYVSYWTGVARWEGVYLGAHSLGHSMTLLLMTIGLYVILKSNGQSASSSAGVRNILLGSFALVALYCLYMSQVRSATLGLLTFSVIVLYVYQKKALVFGAVGLSVLAVMTVPYWVPRLIPEYAMMQRGIQVDTLDLGMGRPRAWLNDIDVFSRLPLDQKLAGVGIGTHTGLRVDGELIGHNDWLDLLTQTGLIGVMLFALLQVLIFRTILKMYGRERYAFLALFLAVNVMMMASNSYAWRIQVSQLYYMVLVFIELQTRHAGAATVDVPLTARTAGFNGRSALYRANLGLSRRLARR